METDERNLIGRNTNYPSSPTRHNQPERLADLEVRYAEIILKPPQRYPGAKEKILSLLKCKPFWLYESHPPSDTEPLEWMLFTNMPVNSMDDIIRRGKRGRWYRLSCVEKFF